MAKLNYNFRFAFHFHNASLQKWILFRRGRLHIVGRAHAKKILFEKNSKEKLRTSGIVYVKDGKEVQVKAKKEVILSAGVFGSPQLLMLSGVGPKSHLEDVGVMILGL